MIYRSHAPRLCPNYSQHYPEGNTTPDLFTDIESGGDKAKNKALADISDTADAGEERARGQYGKRGQPAVPGNKRPPRPTAIHRTRLGLSGARCFPPAAT